MHWRDYERAVFDEFTLRYPTSAIRWNVNLPGVLSGVERQIDILVDATVGGAQVRTIIDAKMYGKAIDVKHVEEFLGLLKDVDAQRGMMVTTVGYSKAALARAHRDVSDVELDVMSVAEFREFQAPIGIPFSGPNAVILPAPFGWIVDNASAKQFPAVLYQRGLTFHQAVKSLEWAYYQFWPKDVVGTPTTVEALIEKQNIDLRDENVKTQIERLAVPETMSRSAGIRLAKRPHHPAWEYTGVVEFEDFLFFIVMFTPQVVANRNLRKLIEAMSWVKPGKIRDLRENKRPGKIEVVLKEGGTHGAKPHA